MITPATHYPFQPGQAVWYVPQDTSPIRPPRLIPAIVCASARWAVSWRHKDAPRVTIGHTNGRLAGVKGHFLVYRGYCPRCELPAVERSGLCCPRCEALAIPEPPPDELALRWYPPGHSHMAQSVRVCLLTGCAWAEGLDVWRKRYHTTFYRLVDTHGMRRQMYDRLGPWGTPSFSDLAHWYAERGDDDGFLRAYQARADELPEDGPSVPLPWRRITPLTIIRRAA